MMSFWSATDNTTKDGIVWDTFKAEMWGNTFQLLKQYNNYNATLLGLQQKQNCEVRNATSPTENTYLNLLEA